MAKLVRYLSHVISNLGRHISSPAYLMVNYPKFMHSVEIIEKKIQTGLYIWLDKYGIINKSGHVWHLAV